MQETSDGARAATPLLTSSRDSSLALHTPCLRGVRAARSAEAQAAMARPQQPGTARSKAASSLLLLFALLALLRPGASLYGKKDDVETLTAANFEGERAHAEPRADPPTQVRNQR